MGPVCCTRLCVCKDYVVLPATGLPPPPRACDATDAANVCCNLAGRAGNPLYPNCP